MRLVFMGSGAFAIPSFEALLGAGHEVKALVTQPDREKGRGRALAPPPLKPVAERHGVRVLQPERIRAPEAQAALQELAPELVIVVAYGQILPRSILDLPPRGCVNVHASLLPRYRGAAPIQWAIARGEDETGVTTMLLDEGLDTGPTLGRRSLAIGAEETAGELEARLAALGALVLLETVAGLAAGTVAAIPQDAAQATLAPLIRKEDGRLDWTLPARLLACRVRGFRTWPGAFTSIDGKTLKVLRAREAPAGPGEPGLVVGLDGDALVVGGGQGTRLALLEVQPESRAAMSARAFAAGHRVGAGARLGA